MATKTWTTSTQKTGILLAPEVFAVGMFLAFAFMASVFATPAKADFSLPACTKDADCGSGNTCFKYIDNTIKPGDALNGGKADATGACLPTPTLPLTLCSGQAECAGTDECYQVTQGTWFTSKVNGYCRPRQEAAAPVIAAPGAIELIKPRLEIPIPNVTFSGTTLNLIGEYFAGVYKYLLSVVGIFATVMMMVGGFQFLTAGGDKNRADAGRKRIMNALTGLILAFGSYAMLYVINPALVKFEALQIASVNPEPFTSGVFEQMGWTESDTGLGDQSPAPVPGELTYEVTACPFTYEAPWTEANARKKEFITKIQPFLTKTDIRERIVQAAEYADMCDPNLGSCGTTVGTIIALAYKGHPSYESMSKRSSSHNSDCLDPNLAAKSGKARDRFNCNGFSLGSIKEVGEKLRREQYGRRCEIDQVKSTMAQHAKLVSEGKIKPETFIDGDSVRCNATTCTSNKVTIPRTPCAKTDGEARLEFVKIVQAGGIAGYPDSWADLLRPGDYINIYNGNTDLTGGHAILFMGWAKDGKNAYVVQGGGGCATGLTGKQECKIARPGKTCLREKCGDSIRPMTSIYRVK